jgi:Nucleotidyltransferase substrate binding protein like
VRTAREARLLTDEQTVTALEMVDDRNETVHTYNEAVAARIFGTCFDTRSCSARGSMP